MEKLLSKERKPFGDDDIRRHLPDAKIITYPELVKYKSIDELLPGATDYCIILYEDSPNHGHWTALTKHAGLSGGFSGFFPTHESVLKQKEFEKSFGGKKRTHVPRMEDGEFELPFSDSKGYQNFGFGKSQRENINEYVASLPPYMGSVGRGKGDTTVEFFDSYGGSPDSQQSWVPKQTRVELGEGKPFLRMLLDKCPYPVRYNHVHYQADNPEIADCGRHCVNRVKSLMEKGYDLDAYKKWMDACCKKTGLDYDGVVTELIE